MQHLARLIEELGHGKARIGVELENYYYSAKAHLTLVAKLPGADFADATALVNRQRTVKSDEELAFMRRAARIAEKVVTTALERAEPGKRKNELVGDILQAGAYGVGRGLGRLPGDRAADPVGWPMPRPRI